jgi:hypothetical protein
LEGESQGKADPVEASELADLLTGKGIPVCILNACQSGKQISASLTPTPPLLNLSSFVETMKLGEQRELGEILAVPLFLPSCTSMT